MVFTKYLNDKGKHKVKLNCRTIYAVLFHKEFGSLDGIT